MDIWCSKAAFDVNRSQSVPLIPDVVLIPQVGHALRKGAQANLRNPTIAQVVTPLEIGCVSLCRIPRRSLNFEDSKPP